MINASKAQAAILYLDPSQANYYQSETFPVEIRLDTEGECINAIEANIVFPADILEFVDFSQGNSILSLWVQEPKISVDLCGDSQNLCGSVLFSGGVPGGYCGEIPGNPGQTNLLGKIFFHVKPQEIVNINPAQVSFKYDTTQVLLNDGYGTPAKLTTKEAVFNIMTEKIIAPRDRWQEEIVRDQTPPEPFKIELNQDPLIFDGKSFITFLTTDKQTGIDHYEVYEIPTQKLLLTKKNLNAQSPYLLQDQSLRSTIIVKAVDKAGNERAETSNPRQKALFPYQLIILALIIILLLSWVIMKIFYNGTKHKN